MSDTIVTGIFDIGRGNIRTSFVRPFSYYLNGFAELLGIDQPLIVYIQKQYEDFVHCHRKAENTVIRTVELEDIESFPHYEQIQKIRKSQNWVNQAAWLKDSPQYLLAHYVPLMIMRHEWLYQEASQNPFKTDRFYWLDGGILSNWRYSSFGRRAIENKIPGRKFLLYSFPYRRSSEIHGFPSDAMARFCGAKTMRWICRGGLCGGPIHYVQRFAGYLREIAFETLAAGCMGTDENLLTIAAQRHPELISRRMTLRDRLSFLGPLYAFYRKRIGAPALPPIQII